ncbi:hypothetical protein ACH5RR_000958 [Cinchona calisaya]|uniref:F-box protein FBW2 n=1 Tax=Cinchona calisaya TaxID=153742 RepID=A0ABD3B229_9GENT
MVSTVSLVCRGWMEAVAGPYCWTEIDVEDWCRSHWNRCNTGSLRCGLLIDSVVRKLVRRSKCSVQKLSAYRLGDAGFSYIANCGRCLKVLRIPVSEITDEMVEKHAKSLMILTELDISNCLKITSRGLETFGKNCKSLTHLKRNMPPPELGGTSFPVIPSEIDDHEAFTIAENMAGLSHLELGFARLTDHGLGQILTRCKALMYLNIEGCWNVSLEGDLEQRCKRLLIFKNPWIDENESERSTENESERSTENDSREADQTGDDGSSS